MSRFLPARRRGRSDPPDPPGRPRRSVYENRFKEEAEEERIPLGELDPVTGRSTADYSKASGWRPLDEFLRRRG
jgi:hypothetical protein